MNQEKNTKLTKEEKSNVFKIPDFIKAEMFLECSGYFTPSSKRIKNISKDEKFEKKRKIKVVNQDGTSESAEIEIIASRKYGLPITSDLDYYRAFLKICSESLDENNHLSRFVSVPTSKLLRYAGKTRNSRNWNEVRDWFNRLSLTGITKVYNAKKKEMSAGETVKIFDSVKWKGDTDENGKVFQNNYVKLSDWFLGNFNAYYVKTIDFGFYKRLRKPISKALHALLEVGWYASNGNPYRKKYEDICEEFTLKRYKSISDIKRQLDPVHNELSRENFLAKWEYTLAKIKKDYVISYYPGEKFFQDQKARIQRKQTADQITIASKPAISFKPLTEKQQYLVEKILAVCKDTQNRVAYEKLVRDKSESLIDSALGETKIAIHRGQIKKTPGAFFTDMVKRIETDRATAK